MESRGEEPRPVLPPPVQEVAGKGAVPARYVARAGDDSKATATAVSAPAPATAPVPGIDLACLCQPSSDDGAHDHEASKLRLALKSWGVFLVTNHGIEASLMDAVMDASREFFRQPLEEKQKHTNTTIDGKLEVEGYGNDRVTSEDQVLDWCDRLYLKVQPQDERNLQLWPTRLRDLLHEFTNKCTMVKDCLLLEMAKLLELDDDYFIKQFSDKAITYARFNYYPACSRPDLVFGMKPHSDGACVSLLMVDDSVGGLQVLRDGVWYDMPTSPRTLIINLGDQTEIMSNGIFKSPVHRVVTNAEKERLSVVLFYSIDPEREIQPADKLIDENHPAVYKKVKVNEYIASLYEHFSRGKSAIETAKI